MALLLVCVCSPATLSFHFPCTHLTEINTNARAPQSNGREGGGGGGGGAVGIAGDFVLWEEYCGGGGVICG